MPAVGSNSVCRMDLKFREFSEKLRKSSSAMGREGTTYVQSQSRRLVKKWAHLAPMKTGRLRAGFWPVAVSLQMTNIYTRYPNRGEGYGINKSQDKRNPAVYMGNTVPYVAYAGRHGTSWWYAGINAIMARMEKDVENHVRKAWDAGL